MARPPRDPRAPILTRALLGRVLLVGDVILGGAFGLFEWELELGAGLDEARTAAVNVVVMVAIFYLLNCRSLVRPAWQASVRSNPWVLGGIVTMLGLQALFTYAPVMNRLFASAPITLDAWLRIVALGAAAFVLVEVEKWIRRSRAG